MVTLYLVFEVFYCTKKLGADVGTGRSLELGEGCWGRFNDIIRVGFSEGFRIPRSGHFIVGMLTAD